MNLSQTQLANFRKKGIHMQEFKDNQQDLMRYTFSNFHPPKLSMNDLGQVRNHFSQTPAVGPEASTKGIETIISGNNFDAKHMTNFIKK